MKAKTANTAKTRCLSRGLRTRHLQSRLKIHRLMVHLTNKHTYVQLLSPEAKVLAYASTLEKEVRANLSNGGNIEAARLIGSRLAQKVKQLSDENGLGKLGFDRGGRSYTGRIKALAEAAREGGLSF